MKDLRKPEILAPAGSMEALYAAVHAGADAVYLGGNRFGARAFADNFDGDALLHAIEYAHLYGVKVYLTINTLFRDEEIEALYDYLLPLYEAGLDAVIVQDLGVISYVHEIFPNLPIHASTQMTITTKYAFSLLRDYGVTRIVPARELSIEEIAALKETSGTGGEAAPEVEVFVQGALCYCYSGQCLMSSILGGRSGNRGRCAQTCRLPYEVFKESGTLCKTNGRYVLSPKDLCGLESIPMLIEAGVDSFKIEGRMKKPEYVAACVRAYRTCVDAWFEGKLTKELIQDYKQQMAEVFNRGGFTEGYFKKHNGRDMMSIEHPGNVGVKAGSILGVNKNKVTIKLLKDVFPGDILVIPVGDESVTLTSNVHGKSGTQIVLNASRSKLLSKGMTVRRMQQERLNEELSRYSREETKIPVFGRLTLELNRPAVLQIHACIKGMEYDVTVLGEQVQSASNNPLTEDGVLQKITATGNTRYQFEKLKVEMENGVFYPLKALKELRRNALESLERKICNESRRNYSDRSLYSRMQKEQEICKRRESCPSVQKDKKQTECAVMVSSIEQYKVVLETLQRKILRKNFADIYLDLQYFRKEDIIGFIAKNREVNHFLVLPPVLRERNLTEVEEILRMIQAGSLTVSGIVVRNIDEFALVKRFGMKERMITDYSFYAMNVWAIDWILGMYDKVTVTLPVELNELELLRLTEHIPDSQLVMYGHQQLMVSTQCVQNTVAGCNQADQKLILKDRYQKPFFVRCICKYCYNLIYNGIPTVLFDVEAEDLKNRVTPRIHFTVEDEERTKEVLEAFLEDGSYKDAKTRGHYKRGVE